MPKLQDQSRPLATPILLAVTLATNVWAKDIPLNGSVYTPHPGVLCDKKGGFCADSQGIAFALTKLYLGEKAERRLLDMVKSGPGLQDFDTSVFVLTNKVACDCKKQQCTVSKLDEKVDVAHTRALFGK